MRHVYLTTIMASSPNIIGNLEKNEGEKGKEERVRMYREHQEEERLKKLREIEQQFMMSKKHREQLEEERKRRIEEARQKELERRNQVEERKRQIWEAEQERKEAILRRNLEREARIEARRNAQRNSQCFAFGSSTPRTFDFDLAAIGRAVSQGPVLMSSVSMRRSEEREVGPPRATSACSLDRKLEIKTSMGKEIPSILDQNYSYKQIAYRHKSSNDMKACLSANGPPPSFSYRQGAGVLVGGEDLMTRSMISLSTFRGRKRTDITPTLSRERSITPHSAPRGKQSMRAVSMTRLDQLAQPRQSYREHRYQVAINTANSNSSDMSRSLCNLANNSAMGKRTALSPTSCHSQSMLHLADNKASVPNPTNKSKIRPAQSMIHIAAPPRLTRAAKLRAQALSGSIAKSAWNLNKTDPARHYLSPGKDTSRSPSRPQSSMSGASDISATSSSISLRAHSHYRRQRPISVAGSIADSSVHLMVKKDLEQQSQSVDKNASAEKRKVKKESLESKKKPIPPPKSSVVLARAKSHPLPPPSKDNLRKAQKPSSVISSTVDTHLQVQHTSKTLPQDKSNFETEMKVENESSNIETDQSNIVTKKSEMIDHSSAEVANSNDSALGKVLVQRDSNPISASFQTSKETVTEIQTPIIPDKIDLHSKEVSNLQSEVKTPTDNGVIKDTKIRITSEEEARIALAEKRRLAREQAEREAELERQRLEELRKEEEERKRLEEAEQKRIEEEQIRLAALHRQFEEEKLRKAIEEQQQREMEEQRRKEEELRQKAEREELERKAREEAEKQRIELEEKLRKEEEERAERKRRVEQIMARTRNKMAASSSETSKSAETVKEAKAPLSSKEYQNGCDFTSGTSDHSQNPLPDLLNSESKTNGTCRNYEEQLSGLTNSANLTRQSNGYDSHEDMSCTTSPDERSDAELLIDEQSCDVQKSSEFTKLVDLEPLLDNSVKNDNLLIEVDDFNSNVVDSGRSFEDTDFQRSCDTVIPDLLS